MAVAMAARSLPNPKGADLTHTFRLISHRSATPRTVRPPQQAQRRAGPRSRDNGLHLLTMSPLSAN